MPSPPYFLFFILLLLILFPFLLPFLSFTITYGYASYQNSDDPDEWEFMDQTGKTIFTLKCKRLGALSEGMISYEDQNGDWGFVDEKGNVVIPAQYQNPTNDDPYFSEGLAAVEKNGKCGYIDPKGKTVIGFQYSVANPFSDGVAVVSSMDGKSGENTGLIDKDQKIVIPMQYKFITDSKEGMVGVTAAGRNDLTAFFTDEGKQITGFDYCYDSMYRSFHDGIAIVQTEKSGPQHGWQAIYNPSANRASRSNSRISP